jgi:hypothetical protein
MSTVDFFLFWVSTTTTYNLLDNILMVAQQNGFVNIMGVMEVAGGLVRIGLYIIYERGRKFANFKYFIWMLLNRQEVRQSFCENYILRNHNSMQMTWFGKCFLHSFSD